MLSGAQRVHDPALLTERAKLHEIGNTIYLTFLLPESNFKLINVVQT